MIKRLARGFYTSAKAFDDKSQRNKRILYYGIYSLVFAFTAIIVFSYFIINKKSFIWRIDGLKQHYTSLVYFGTYLRGIITDFLSTGSINIPMWDFSIGYGSDIMTTLHYYVIGDPLNLLSVFVPSDKMDLLYDFLILLRLYLAGFAFSAYCRKMVRGRFATLCGSVIYVFCGFALYASVRHPYFINPMIYLPLLLIGIEKIYAKQKPYVFILMIFLSAASSFYFFYMLSVLIVIYAAIRFFTVYDVNPMKNLFKSLFSFIGYYIVGLFMACVIFLPIVQSLMSGNRMKAQSFVDLFYPATYYHRILANFISSSDMGFWSYLGYSVVSLVCVVLLFTKRKKNTQLKIGFILLSLFLLIPFMGHILHGFSYATNRWVWGYSFVIALITTVVIPEIFKVTKKQLKILSIFSIAYFALCMFMEYAKTEEFFVFYSIFLLAIILVFFIYITNKENAVLSKRFKYTARLSFLAIIILGIVVQASYRYDYNHLAEFINSGKSYSILTETPARAVNKINDNSFYRFEENKFGGQGIHQNASMLHNQNSTAFYFSLSNPHISNYLMDINGAFPFLDFNYSGLDNRAMPGALAGNKYYVVKKGLERFIPYGYNNLVSTYKDFLVYENDYTLPLGYTYSAVIPKSEYEKLSPIEKQQAMLQGGVIDTKVNSLLSKSVNPIFNDRNISYEINCGKGVEYIDGAFIVSNTQATVTLILEEGPRNAETYLDIENLYFSGINPLDKYTGEEWSKLDKYQQNSLRSKHKYWQEPAIANFTVESGDISKTIELQTLNYTWYNAQHNFTVNLCYSNDAKTQIELKFAQEGKYTFDNIKVTCQPMDNYPAQINALREDVLENISISSNSVSGNISLNKDKLLCLLIPYSEGWKAYVNGKETELLNVNVMYSGIYLEAGNYNIELKYTTPYLKHGIILSVTGLFLFILIIFFNKYRASKSKLS